MPATVYYNRTNNILIDITLNKYKSLVGNSMKMARNSRFYSAPFSFSLFYSCIFNRNIQCFLQFRSLFGASLPFFLSLFFSLCNSLSVSNICPSILLKRTEKRPTNSKTYSILPRHFSHLRLNAIKILTHCLCFRRKQLEATTTTTKEKTTINIIWFFFLFWTI